MSDYKKNKDGFISVYHLIPRNNGKSYQLMRMGESKPLKSFTKEKSALAYIDKNLRGSKVYINDVKNRVKLYKN